MNTNPDKPIIQIDFKKRSRTYKSLGAGLYLDPRSPETEPRFYERPFVNGRQTFRRLMARTERLARMEIGKNRGDQRLARRGFADDPYKPKLQGAVVQKLAEFYLESDCPKRRGGVRTVQTLRDEKRRVATLVQWWGKKLLSEVSPENQRKYHDWRCSRLKRKANGELRGRGGDRQVDKELITLSNIFRWAVANQGRTGITSSPLRDTRITFRNSKSVRHCRDCMPENGDELHAIASYLFSSPRGEVLGWLALIQAMIGQRVSELLHLRLDALTEQAGWIQRTRDGKIGKALWLYRSETSKGTYSHAAIHASLRECLNAFLAWHHKRYPNSPWFFPSPEDPKKPVSVTALTHALRRICPAMGIALKTSHGLRAYFVNVLRSDRDADGRPRISDAEIALRIGQISGGALIRQVYGDILPHPIFWVPTEAAPAWSPWLGKGQPAVISQQLELEL